jgi:hypothetical protein
MGNNVQSCGMDDLKIYIDEVQTTMIGLIDEELWQQSNPTVTRGRHDYLGMTLDYTEGKIKMLDSVVKKIDIPWKI